MMQTDVASNYKFYIYFFFIRYFHILIVQFPLSLVQKFIKNNNSSKFKWSFSRKNPFHDQFSKQTRAIWLTRAHDPLSKLYTFLFFVCLFQVSDPFILTRRAGVRLHPWKHVRGIFLFLSSTTACNRRGYFHV